MSDAGRDADAFWRGRICLITGAGGFIGSALSRHLHARGAQVIGSGRAGTAPRGWSGGEWRACDVTNLGQVKEVFAGVKPQVVFHLASRVSGSRSLELVLPTFNDNLVGTLNVLLATAEVAGARLICLGSLQEPDLELQGVPNSPYAAAKFAAGAYARMFAALYDVNVSIARPFMVYGPGQLDFTKLVPHVLSRLIKGEPAELSSGRQAFDWVYVDDVVEALLAIAAREDIAGRTIDVGCGVLTTVRDVALGLARRLGREGQIRLGALPDRRLEQTRVADVEATARLVGWRASVDVEEGLDRTAKWFQEHLA